MARYKNHVVTIPDPVLRKKSSNLKKSEINSRNLNKLLEHMVKILDLYDGVGLSAVQIGLPKNLFIIRSNLDKEKINLKNWKDEIEVYINSEILQYHEPKVDSWEGCLSIPNIQCLVERASKIKVRYIDLDGNEVVREIDDFKSIVFQHEYDHTQGILIIDKAKQIKQVGD
ncbi:MAG: peptide deformylase [bacterium]